MRSMITECHVFLVCQRVIGNGTTPPGRGSAGPDRSATHDPIAVWLEAVIQDKLTVGYCGLAWARTGPTDLYQ